MMQSDMEIERAVDTVCALGCEKVNERIEILRRGESCPECRSLNQKQREAVLQILQSIMAVYDFR
jgi:hypothetical protein